MKKFLFIIVCVCLLGTGVRAQAPKTYHQFTVTKEVAATPVKDQNRSGTCWSFSGLGFLESELLRMGKGEMDLADMWIVRNSYYDQVVKYVRLHGNMTLSAGGAWEDIINVIKDYGIVPEEVYRGLNYGLDNHNHAELDEVILAYGKAIVENKGKTLTTAWKDGLNGILDAYFGKVPEKFIYNGKEYTPKSFAASLGLNMDDYVSITSFTHHPFYTAFAIEIPDNWSWGLSYNVPLDEMMQIAEDAINKGYPVWWGSDVSEPGFLYQYGMALSFNDVIDTGEGTEQAKWVAMSPAQKQQVLGGRVNEKVVTQAERQFAFDNYDTTDDHGMVITGIATDQDGQKYFKVKNSWTANGIYGGYFYASFPFVRYKTIDIAVNKNVLSKELKAKLGIK